MRIHLKNKLAIEAELIIPTKEGTIKAYGIPCYKNPLEIPLNKIKMIK